MVNYPHLVSFVVEDLSFIWSDFVQNNLPFIKKMWYNNIIMKNIIVGGEL